MIDHITRTVVDDLPAVQVFGHDGELLGEAIQNPQTGLWDMSVMRYDGPDSISATYAGSAANADLAVDLVDRDASGESLL